MEADELLFLTDVAGVRNGDVTVEAMSVREAKQMIDDGIATGQFATPGQQIIYEIIVTNTLPIPQDRHFDKLTVLSIAPLISRAIREVFEDGSVTSIFDGQT